MRVRQRATTGRVALDWRRVLAAIAACVGVAACAGTNRTDVIAAAPRPLDTTVANGDASDGSATASGGGASGSATSVAASGQPSSITGNGQTVSIAFVGDVVFEDAAASSLTSDPNAVFGPITSVLSSADLTIANLETAVTNGGGARASKQFAFAAPPEAFDAIRASGIDIVSMANNHGMDYGREGLRQTLDAIKTKEFPVVGIGGNETDAYRPHIVEIKGQRIGIIGATQVLDDDLVEAWTATDTNPGLASAKRVERLVAEVTELRPKVDTLIVFLHWGTEKMTCPNEAQKELAPSLVAAGADIVAGGHQHRLAGAGYMGASLVAYGLGNFLFKSTSEGARQTGVLTVNVTGRRVDGYTFTPARINNSNQPIPLQGADAEAAVANWNTLQKCTELAAEPVSLEGAG